MGRENRGKRYLFVYVHWIPAFVGMTVGMRIGRSHEV